MYGYAPQRTYVEVHWIDTDGTVAARRYYQLEVDTHFRNLMRRLGKGVLFWGTRPVAGSDTPAALGMPTGAARSVVLTFSPELPHTPRRQQQQRRSSTLLSPPRPGSLGRHQQHPYGRAEITAGAPSSVYQAAASPQWGSRQRPVYVTDQRKTDEMLWEVRQLEEEVVQLQARAFPSPLAARLLDAPPQARSAERYANPAAPTSFDGYVQLLHEQQMRRLRLDC